MRIFWLFNHPAPYKVEFFNRLGLLCDLTVYFERHKEGGRNATFYGKGVKNFHAYFGHPLILGSINSYSREPIKFLKKHEEYDLIVLNGWRTITERLCISYCKSHKIPYVFYINGGIIRKNENNIKYGIKRHYIAGARFYMAPDERSKEYLLHYGANPGSIALFPYGSVAHDEILSEPYSSSGIAKIRKKVGIAEGRAFVSAGFFIERKNFEALIQAWSLMPSTDHLYLIGEGKLEKTYARKIEQLHLENVHILPFMDHSNLFRFYRACDAFVFPSKEDIYGHVITEALSQGLPVFSSANVNASIRLIEPGVNGGIVDFDNIEEVAMVLKRPIRPETKQACIDSARQFTFENSAKAHEALFQKMVEALEKEKK